MGTYIVELELENWMRYAGRCKVQLEPTVYAVVAEWLGEPGRSNWGGKSAALEAIAFALTGAHRFRTEDEWITNGAERGAVTLRLSDGHEIVRQRKVGSATSLTVQRRGRTWTKGEAQQRVYDSVLGVRNTDEFYTLYFAEQRELAAMVRAKPEEFTERLRDWMPELAELERVEAGAIDRVNECADAVKEEENLIAMIAADVDGGEPCASADDARRIIGKCIVEAEAAVKRDEGKECAASGELQRAQGAMELANEYWRHEDALKVVAVRESELNELLDDLKQCGKKQVNKQAQAAEQAYDKVRSKVGKLEEDVQQLAELVKGKFDGKCPLTNAACPVKDAVARACMKRATDLVKARVELKQYTEGPYTTAHEHRSSALQAVREVAAKVEKVVTLQRIVDEAKVHREYCDEHARPKLRAELTQAVVDAQTLLGDVRSDLAVKREALRRYEYRLGQIDKASGSADVMRVGVARYSRIALAASRQYAQREFATMHTRRIERLGNALLGGVGIDLGFRVAWTAEGKKLSMQCEGCYHRFTGQRDKACPRCGKERGMHVIDRPHLELTDKSGAAEDLVGAAFRLAGGAWIRARRQSAWSCTMIDEPFGALDEANREVFARVLPALLKGQYGFDQAFVVSHNEDVNAAMPARLKVVASRSGSRLEVV